MKTKKKQRKNEDFSETLRLVKEIDESDNRLRKTEINFIARIIDDKQKTFTLAEVEKVKDIHHKRVVNGKPDYDL